MLIFKNEIKDEVSKEIADLQKAGIPAENIYQIPFKGKDMGPAEEDWVQLVQGLDYLVKIEKLRAHKILFRCTAGEDRMGALAVAGLIIDGKISFNNLSTSVCRAGGFKSATYSNLFSLQKTRYTGR